MSEEKHKAEKIDITFQDGHTESFDIFIALVASGLTPVGREGNSIIYMAEEGKLQTRAIAHVTATTEVMAALVSSISEIVDIIISHSTPEEGLEFLKALLSVKARRVTGHTDIRTKEIHPSEN